MIRSPRKCCPVRRRSESDRQVGDLGNIEADSTGVAKGVLKTGLIKLTGGYKVVGRSFVVHQDPGTGKRLAGGAIKLA